MCKLINGTLYKMSKWNWLKNRLFLKILYYESCVIIDEHKQRYVHTAAVTTHDTFLLRFLNLRPHYPHITHNTAKYAQSRLLK